MGLLGMLRGRSMDRELDEELAESDEHDLFGSPVQATLRQSVQRRVIENERMVASSFAFRQLCRISRAT